MEHEGPHLRARLAGARPLLIGAVHLRPLPGAPDHAGGMAPVLAAAAADARAWVEGGADALVVENFGDVPFFAGAVPPETVAGLALALAAVADAAPELPVGVNVLRNDARSAVALCATTAASFLRVNVHVGAAVSDQGLLEGRAAETLRERARLAPDAVLLADIDVKHAAPLTPRPLAELAREAVERGGADLVIVSGPGTGLPAAGADVAAAASGAGPERVLVGSGLTPENAGPLLADARGAIVGTWCKEEGDVRRPVDPRRVARLRAALDRAR